MNWQMKKDCDLRRNSFIVIMPETVLPEILLLLRFYLELKTVS